MNQEFLKYLPLFIAFVAGFFALLQIRTNNITNARIKWLETFKTVLADFNSEIFMLTMGEGIVKHIDLLESTGHHSDLAEQFANTINDRTINQLKTIQHKFDMIQLNLNPEEDLHVGLLKMLNAYMDLVNKIPVTDSAEQHELSKQMQTVVDKLILMVRYTLKLEWEKIKRNKFSHAWYMWFGKGKLLKKKALAMVN